MRTALYATHPILAVSVLERDARGCWSTSHRPLSCRCGCNRACTEHDMDAGDMPGQYAVSRAPHSHTLHIRFSRPSNVREICPHWTKGRLSLPEPDETRLCSRGLGRASTSPPRAAVAVAVRIYQKIEYICAIVREAINIQYIVNSCRPRRRRAASREYRARRFRNFRCFQCWFLVKKRSRDPF